MRVVLAAVTIFLVGGAHLQPAIAEDDAKLALAKRHYETGTAYYQTANYEEALVEFRKAQKLYPMGQMHFNIGRCLEGLGRLDQAVKSYETFLREVPKAKERAMVEERIRNLNRRIEAGKPKPVAQETEAPTPAPTSPPEPVDDGSDPSRPWRITGWTLVATGAAALVISGVLGGLAMKKTGEYEDAHKDHLPYHEARPLLEDAEGYEKGCFIALGLGLAVTAAGTAILLLKGRSDQRATAWRRLQPRVAGTNLLFRW